MNTLFDLPERIQHCLILKTKFLSDYGLLSGKTGIAIAFAYLHKQYRNEVYYDCMSELLDDILENTYQGLNMDFASGFSGIGWGIEYLIQNQFVAGDGVEVCKELDKKIMEKDPRRISDVSLESGLEGLLHYVLAHLNGAVRKGGSLPFDNTYLEDLNVAVRSHRRSDETSFLDKLIDMYEKWYDERGTLDYRLDIKRFIQPMELGEKSLSNYSLGLKNGLSGVLLKTLL